MELTFAPRDILQINDARIIYRNLRGEGSKFNREGDRNFAVVIPNQELADELIDRGWNVKIKEPRDEGEEPFRYLPVKVKFNDRGPQVYLVSGNAHRELSEDMVSIVDEIDIRSVNLDVRPYVNASAKSNIDEYVTKTVKPSIETYVNNVTSKALEKTNENIESLDGKVTKINEALAGVDDLIGEVS